MLIIYKKINEKMFYSNLELLLSSHNKQFSHNPCVNILRILPALHNIFA